jgi:GNAT superfamily N-acetyltransferase
MEIRRLGPRDGALLDAAVRAFRGFEHRADHGCLTDPGAVAVVALDGETVVGWAFGHELPHPAGPSSLALYELDVAGPARGGGIGRALLDAFATAARERGFDAMSMLTGVDPTIARNLYPSAGGRPEGRGGPWWVFDVLNGPTEERG